MPPHFRMKSRAPAALRLFGRYWSKRTVRIEGQLVHMLKMSRGLYRKFRRKFARWQSTVSERFQFESWGLKFDSHDYDVSLVCRKRRKVYVYSWLADEKASINETDGKIEAAFCEEVTVEQAMIVGAQKTTAFEMTSLRRGLSIQEQTGDRRWTLHDAGTMISGQLKTSPTETTFNIVVGDINEGRLLAVQPDGSVQLNGRPEQPNAEFRKYVDSRQHPFQGVIAVIQSVKYPNLFMSAKDDAGFFKQVAGDSPSPDCKFRIAGLKPGFRDVKLFWQVDQHSITISGINEVTFLTTP